MFVRSALIILLGSVFWICYQSFASVSEPLYEVVSDHINFEVRQYSPMIFAYTEDVGELEKSLSSCFRLLADYIFAKNGADYEPIEMTAPVLFQQKGPAWIVRFVLPERYLVKAVPQPLNYSVKITHSGHHKMAVFTLSGSPTLDVWREAERQFKKALSQANIKMCGDSWFARYNPPWTPSFMRRNEILIPVK